MVYLKRILVPIDFSERSEAALQYGVELARRFSARLYLLNVPEHPGKAAAECLGLFGPPRSRGVERRGRVAVGRPRPEISARV